MDEEQISRLAASFQDGNLSSFRILVDGLTRPLLATAYRYTGNWESAHDLTQETWIRVYEKIESYDPGRPFRPWLTTIHRRGCLNHLRRSATQREIATDAQAIDRFPEAPHGHDPCEALYQKEFAAMLRRAMLALTEKQRTVFAHVDIEQIDQQEVARMMRMSFSTLRATLHFARKRLAGLLRKMEESPWTAR
jgi:RNA polymerase sigma-70 factor (ECF subfamily)